MLCEDPAARSHLADPDHDQDAWCSYRLCKHVWSSVDWGIKMSFKMWHWNQDVFQHPGWWCGGGIQNNFARNSKEWLEWVEWDLVLDNRGRCHRVVTKSFLECAIYCHYTCYIILTFNFLHAAYPLFHIDLEVSWLRGRISSGYCKEFHSLGAKGGRTRRLWALSESTTLSCFLLQFFPMQNGTPIFVCPQYYCTEGTQKQLCTAL